MSDWTTERYFSTSNKKGKEKGEKWMEKAENRKEEDFRSAETEKKITTNLFSGIQYF